MRLSFQLDREQIRPRVEAHHELRPLALDGLGEAVCELRRRDGCHALSLLVWKDGEGRLVAALAFLGGEARS
jgi:hypothetical protein